ncbi:MAG: hypothetical protein SLRJCFUN_001124, partial [Candidatus Fervidibacter sp.]
RNVPTMLMADGHTPFRSIRFYAPPHLMLS